MYPRSFVRFHYVYRCIRFQKAATNIKIAAGTLQDDLTKRVQVSGHASAKTYSFTLGIDNPKFELNALKCGNTLKDCVVWSFGAKDGVHGRVK